MSNVGRKIIALYSSCNFKVRFYVRIRWLLTVFETVETFVPKEGTVLDLGCGYGIFTNLLALKGPKRQIWAVDFDKERIFIASKATKAMNIKFLVGDLKNWQIKQCDAIVLYDVLHHITYAKQELLLRLCYERLSSRGILVIKDNGTSPYWKYLFNYLHEKITQIIGLTKGDELCFRTPHDFQALLSKIGFNARIEYLKTYLPYSFVLFIAKKSDK